MNFKIGPSHPFPPGFDFRDWQGAASIHLHRIAMRLRMRRTVSHSRFFHALPLRFCHFFHWRRVARTSAFLQAAWNSGQALYIATAILFLRAGGYADCSLNDIP